MSDSVPPGGPTGVPACFALLDDSRPASDEGIPLVSGGVKSFPSEVSAGIRQGGARLYTGFVRQIVCTEPADFDAACQALEAATATGLHAVILADYEFGARLQGASRIPGAFRGLLFDTLRRLTPDDANAWLRRCEQADIAAHATGTLSPADDAVSVAGLGGWRTDVARVDFDAAMARIHDWLRAGECYQLNYTYRCEFDAFGSPFALYRRLRARQPVPYGALIALPPEPTVLAAGAAPQPRFVLSLSPELFVRHDAGVLTAQPMKGTAAASGDAATDRRHAEVLAADDKNRAENLMIVDLLRNDLSRVAQPGSVQVPALFDVRRFAGVLQMTSTVTARLRSQTRLADVFRALFPCGSITGAPKHRAMQLIETLEHAPRGLYTGAIGWLDAPPADRSGRQPGNFCLSVAIRTLCLDAPRDDASVGFGAVCAGRLGVGAGIVLDSVAADEWEECRLKARFASALDPGFALLETMHATAAAGVRHRARHLARLRASAEYFGFRFNHEAIDAALTRACAALPLDTPCRVRLALHHDGRIDCTHGVLAPLAQPVAVLLDEGPPWRADDLFLRHKTTVRQRYDAAWRDAESRGAFDTLFFNQRGELTEGARSNVFIRRGDAWLTPPLASGVLPGVMRQAMLDDPTWQAREAVLTRDDLRRADEVLVCNALRGALRARVCK